MYSFLREPKTDTILYLQGPPYSWREDRERDREREKKEEAERVLKELKLRRELKLSKNVKKDMCISEEDDPEAVLDGTRKEWESSKAKRDCIRDERAFKTDTEALLKEDEIPDQKIAIYTSPSSIKEEEEECNGTNRGMKAIEPLSEYKGDKDAGEELSVKKENEGTERVLQKKEEEDSMHGSDTDTIEAASDSDLDKWFRYRKFMRASRSQKKRLYDDRKPKRSLDYDRKRKWSLDDDSERERKRQLIGRSFEVSEKKNPPGLLGGITEEDGGSQLRED